ncbi:TRAP-type C4-dicarboxylate transport system permease small subunit [Rhodobium orientis]|uniref:TRAP transporter small permease protein n=1 Tax=Rhodobium orientis TaxID=34017 RepID=A0A327JHS2_9HYPH|nr:TRAP transporter small permease [Rhodobium orientis]MBB4301881.1 TRAP-type C4-dicarboxylate transport system permease small subunit [Rhodobium orientis]MBK5950119.1 hypothetical protein [Rhodobium orientis]RAI25675.1 hypothetical protein CH339_17095 [Rhodobium orientis]
MASAANDRAVKAAEHHDTDPSSLAARAGWIGRVSGILARGEAIVAGSLAAFTFLLLLLNVVTRALSVPILWVDELAVFAMVWMAFVGASLAIHHRGHIAVTLVSDALPSRPKAWLALTVDLLLLAFILTLLVLIWRWFDPVTALFAENLEAFSLIDFNFIYQEPTVTLGVPKFWFWLILPIFCLTTIVHSLSNIAVSLGRLGGWE